ncbi:bone morphogenetic protein 1-like protein [Aphelenchoides avenae]|nr:bone morphogenetic protein 1-like protein [Aphelenchus avenae]
MTVVPRLLVVLCLIANAYAGGSQTGVKQSESLHFKLFSEAATSSKASNYSASCFPIPPVAANRCPPTSYESIGVISSSYYPNTYANGLDCTYQLKASDNGSTIQLWFGGFYTEQRYDYVRIYDGLNATSPLLATLTGWSAATGANITAPFNSSGQFMYVTFHTDGSGTRSGWFATFSSFRKRAPTYKCSN